MKRLGIATVVFVSLAAAAGWWWVRASLPPLDGQQTLSGLETPVEILFDSYGVPSAYALTADDAWFAAGAMHARDRLWQMELYRRVTSGRLSEVMGERTLPIDRRFLTLGLRDAADAEWQRASPAVRTALERYAAGVNAVTREMPVWKRPLEFQLLGFTPAPWSPQDSLAVGRLLAWRLAENHQAELVRAAIAARFGAASAEELGGRYPADAPTVLGGTISGTGVPKAQVRACGGAGVRGCETADVHVAIEWPQGLEWLSSDARRGGSNNWVVAGRRTRSGRPILANDPHLPIEFPSAWYELHLVAEGLDVAGASIPGVPFVVLGHNARIAWGITNTGADVQDLYLERIDVGRKRVLSKGEWVPVDVRPANIPVKGRGTPERFEIWKTPHGPVFADTTLAWEAPPAWLSPEGRAPGERRAYALRWDADTDVVGSFEALDRASDWAGFLAAVDGLALPSQNLVYADVDGNIGYAMSGRLPLRTSGDGTMPQDGAGGSAEWASGGARLPLPRVFNPPEGFVTSSNNEIDRAFGGLITRDWTAPFRAQRLHDRLADASGVDVEAMAALQNDRRSIAADRILDGLDAVIAEAKRRKLDSAAFGVLERLKAWDRVVDARPVVALYEAFEDALWKRTFHDEMDDALFNKFYEWAGAERPAGLYAVLGNRQSAWFDDIATVDRRETRDDIYLLAATDAEELLERRWGSEANRAWDRVHAASFDHPLGSAAFPLAWLFNRGPVPMEGDGTTVMRVSWNRLRPFAAWEYPAWRQILDAGQWDQSRVVLPAGQSGHPLSPHYFDQNAPWREGRYRVHHFSRAAVTAAMAHRLLLVP